LQKEFPFLLDSVAHRNEKMTMKFISSKLLSPGYKFYCQANNKNMSTVQILENPKPGFYSFQCEIDLKYIQQSYINTSIYINETINGLGGLLSFEDSSIEFKGMTNFFNKIELNFEPNFVEFYRNSFHKIVQNNSNSIIPKKYTSSFFTLKSRIIENIQLSCQLNGTSLICEKNEIFLLQPFDITLLYFKIEEESFVLTSISNGLLIYSNCNSINSYIRNQFIDS
jgi:hypothetical protein